MLLENEHIMSINKETTQGWTWDRMWVFIYSILFMLLLLWWGYVPGPNFPTPHL